MIQAEFLQPASTFDSRPGAAVLLDNFTELTSLHRDVGFFEAFHDVLHHIAIPVLKSRMKRKGERKRKQEKQRECAGGKTWNDHEAKHKLNFMSTKI